MRKNTFLILILLFSIGSSKSAGFDCNKAYSSIEKMICSSERLSWLDEKLNYYYQNAIQNKQQSNEVKYKQRKWLKGTRNLCQDKKCLTSVYIERILELRRITEQKDEIALDMIFPELKFIDVFKDENTNLLLYSATNLEINDRKLYAINYYEKYPGSDRMSYLRIALLEKKDGEYIKLLDDWINDSGDPQFFGEPEYFFWGKTPLIVFQYCYRGCEPFFYLLEDGVIKLDKENYYTSESVKRLLSVGETLARETNTYGPDGIRSSVQIYGPNEPMCCPTRGRIIIDYMVRNNKLLIGKARRDGDK